MEVINFMPLARVGLEPTSAAYETAKLPITSSRNLHVNYKLIFTFYQFLRRNNFVEEVYFISHTSDQSNILFT